MRRYSASVGRSNESTRRAWLESTLSSVPAGRSILDAGAGECQYAELCSHLRYVSQDFGKYEGSGSGAGLQTGQWNNSRLNIISDIAALPIKVHAFDVVMCTEVLEHVLDPGAVVRELSRVLKPGGTLILTAPFASLTHFAPFHFSTGFNRYFYEGALSRLGFRIDELAANGSYYEAIAQELRRLDDVVATYSNARMTRYERLLRRLLLRRLDRHARLDQGSSELLAHGYHVRAIKLPIATSGAD